MRNLKELGKEITKTEQKWIHGGAPKCPRSVCNGDEMLVLQPSCNCY